MLRIKVTLPRKGKGQNILSDIQKPAPLISDFLLHPINLTLVNIGVIKNSIFKRRFLFDSASAIINNDSLFLRLYIVNALKEIYYVQASRHKNSKSFLTHHIILASAQLLTLEIFFFLMNV